MLNPLVFTADTVLPGVEVNTLVTGNSYWTSCPGVKEQSQHEIKDQISTCTGSSVLL